MRPSWPGGLPACYAPVVETTAFLRLALALGIGLLAGLERGWSQRELPEGRRVAGLRTFGLIGLLGGCAGLLSGALGGWLVAAGLISTAALMLSGFAAGGDRRALSATTAVVALVVYLLGALSALGHEREAAAAGVVATALLGFKPQLHGWLERLGRAELEAALKFLLITVAVLPYLPDRGFGPWSALNPYQTWWMVVLIAGISFAGYAAYRLFGSRGGLAATSLLGGLISSTAVTLTLSRHDRKAPGGLLLHAAGIAFASSVMFPRALLEVAAVNAALVPLLAAPVGAAALVGLSGAAILLRRAHGAPATEAPAFRNPMELGAALFFGALLAVVALASAGLKARFGDAGIYATALTAGLMDVDAVALSLSRQAKNGLDPRVAADGILIALAANTVAKTALAAAVSRPRLGALAAGVLLAALAAGGLALALS